MVKDPSSVKGAAKELSPEKRQAIATHVNNIVQATLRMTLLAATSPCKCGTCRAIRDLGPDVSKILELGEQVKTVRAV